MPTPPLELVLGLLAGPILAVIVCVVWRHAFNAGYTLGETHGRETVTVIGAALRPQDVTRAVVAELDRTRYATFGLHGTRADALERLRS